MMLKGILQNMGRYRERLSSNRRRRCGGYVGFTFATFNSTLIGAQYREGLVQNFSVRRVSVDRVNTPMNIHQTNNAKRWVNIFKKRNYWLIYCISGDAPSTLRFEGLHFSDWTGTAMTKKSMFIEVLLTCMKTNQCSTVRSCWYWM